jgi:ATP adenylyltransferase
MEHEQHGLAHLDAPWRMEYIEQAEKAEACIFCAKPCEEETCDNKNYIVHRGEHCFIILNAYPYNSGHLMVIPYQHAADLSALPPETCLEMMRLAAIAMEALKRIMSPDGFNLGMNLGRAGGAGISEHMHLHVVPRWVGDTNFMTTVAQARVLPESLERTWEKVRAAVQEALAQEASATS